MVQSLKQPLRVSFYSWAQRVTCLSEKPSGWLYSHAVIVLAVLPVGYRARHVKPRHLFSVIYCCVINHSQVERLETRRSMISRSSVSQLQQLCRRFCWGPLTWLHLASAGSHGGRGFSWGSPGGATVLCAAALVTSRQWPKRMSPYGVSAFVMFANVS